MPYPENLKFEHKNKVKIKCCVCNEIYKRFTDKNEKVILEHDCLLYESIFQQKKITRIELIK